MKIYFDNVLIDSDNYIEFTYNNIMFDTEFYLGSTASVDAFLKIPKSALPVSINEVEINDGNNNRLFTLIVDNININDNEEAEIKLVDKMVSLNKNYDISTIVPITAKVLLQKICTDFGISYGAGNFTNYNVQISSYDDSFTARDYVSMIAELAGGYAELDNQGIMKIKTFSNTGITNNISIDDIDNYKLGESITIERVVYNTGVIKKETSSNENLYTIYLNPDNLFLQVMTDAQFIALTNNILNFNFNNIKINTTNKIFLNRNLITFTDNVNTYTILNQCNSSYLGGWIGSYEYDLHNPKQQETKIIPEEEKNNKKINRIQIEVDQQAGEITQKVSKDAIISTINQSAEQVQINANKISLAGKNIDLTSDIITINSTKFSVDANGNITATGGTIAGFNIYDKSLSVSIYPEYNYTQSDVSRAAYLSIYGGATQAELQKYDINKDGEIDISDVMIITQIVNLNLTTSNPLVISIATNLLAVTAGFRIYDGNGDSIASMAANGFRYKGNDLIDTSYIDRYYTYSNEDDPPILTKSSGSSNINSCEAVYDYLTHVVELYLKVTTTAQVNSGSDIMTGTISTDFLPRTNEVNGVGYFGGRAIVLRLRHDGTFTLRNAGYQTNGIGSGSTISVSILYYR